GRGSRAAHRRRRPGRPRARRGGRRSAGRPSADGVSARRSACREVLRSSAYLISWLVTTPFLTALILPCHGVFSFVHGGCVRPGGGLVFLNRPPNVWSTFGTYPTTAVVSLPLIFLICSGHWSWTAWRSLSRCSTPPLDSWYPGR